jgi:hypothetical protein
MKHVVCICDECAHTWLASGEVPARCAKCKSSTWDGQPKRDRGRPKKELTSAPVANETIPREPTEEEITAAIEDQAPIESQTVAEEIPESERTIARKMGHALGCDCHSCERMREFFRPKDQASEAKTGAQSASNRQSSAKAKKAKKKA